MKRGQPPRGASDKHPVPKTISRPRRSARVGKSRGQGSIRNAQLTLCVSSRQRTRPINLRLLRLVVTSLLTDLLGAKSAELGITLVGAPEMTALNEAFLQHEGSTDVITFDHSESGTRNLEPGPCLHGEIFICVDEAVSQARRFRTFWQSELTRYIVHGLLHLCGYDDHDAADRRRMKLEENRLLRLLARGFPLKHLSAMAN
jgi:probable rRNA maturation factor